MTDTVPLEVSIHPHSVLEMFPLQVSPEHPEYLVGRPAISSFVAVAQPGLDAIWMLADGHRVCEVQDALAARYRSGATDLAPLLERLVTAGFVLSIDGTPVGPSADETPRRPQWLTRARIAWLFGPRSLVVYVAILILGAAALISDPRLLPRPADVFTDMGMSSAIVPMLLAAAMTAKHELAHVLAARFLGVNARCRLSHRFIFPVIETDLTELWMVERGRRYVAYLAGPISDLLTAAVAVTILWMNRREWFVLHSVTEHILTLIVFIVACVVIWQLNVFLRTDTYYVMSNLLRQRHLADDAKACLRNWRGSWPSIVRVYAIGYAVNAACLGVLAALGAAGVVWLGVLAPHGSSQRSGLIALAVAGILVAWSVRLQRRRRVRCRVVFSAELPRIALLLVATMVWTMTSAAYAGEPSGPSYRISVALDPIAATLEATETIHFRNPLSHPVDELYLHLHANAYSHDQTAFARDRRRLAFFENPMTATPSAAVGGSIAVRSAQVDGRNAPFVAHETVLRISMERPLDSGAEARIDVAFTVRIPRFQDRLAANGSNFVIGAWFPKMAVLDGTGWHAGQRRGIGEFFSEAGDYDVSITAPADFVVGAAGEPIERVRNADGSETSRWRARQVRDFAWVADRRYRVTRTEWQGVSVNYLSFPEDQGAAESGLRTAVAALEYFGRKYGRYPYSRLTLAEVSAVPLGVGIEYPQLVMISDDLHRLTGLTTALETVVVHEIAHQWWYGLVGNNEVDEAWLDEALATYSARRFMRATYGRDLPMLRWPRPFRFLPSPSESELARAMYVGQARTGFDRQVRLSSPDFDDLQSYIVSVYYKGAFVLEMLEYLVGIDTFDRILRIYAERYAYANATSADFIATAEEVSGRDLHSFFAQWLDGTATCDYSVEGVDTSRSGAVQQSVVRVRRRGEAIMPVRVHIVFEDGRTEDQMWDGRERAAALTVRSSSTVKAVQLDPDRHLLETDLVNNQYPRRWSVSANPLSMPSDTYAIGVLPVAWYDGGVELGGVLAAGYPPEIGVPYGLRREHAVSMAVLRNVERGTTRFGISYSSPLETFGRRGTWQAATSWQPGHERVSAGAQWWFGSHFYRAPLTTIGLRALHERHDTAAIRHERGPFDPGTVRAVQGRFTFNRLTTDYFPVRGALFDVAVERGWRAAGSDWNFTRALASTELYRPLASRAKLGFDVVQGVVQGDPPRQRSMRVAADGGFLSRQFDGIWGRSLTALKAELRVPMRESTVDGAAFVHLARYWDRSLTTARGLFSEAGIGLRFFDNAPFAMQIDWPLWVDGAVDGSRGFHARQISIRFGRVFEERDR